MATQIPEHKQSDLKRISDNVIAAREVFQHALGEAFLRFERNIDPDLARDIVDVLKSREQAAQWMAALSASNDVMTVYEIYLEKGRDAVQQMLEAKKAAKN